MKFQLPEARWGEHWVTVIDTAQFVPDLREHRQIHASEETTLPAYSTVVLRSIE